MHETGSRAPFCLRPGAAPNFQDSQSVSNTAQTWQYAPAHSNRGAGLLGTVAVTTSLTSVALTITPVPTVAVAMTIPVSVSVTIPLPLIPIALLLAATTRLLPATAAGDLRHQIARRRSHAICN